MNFNFSICLFSRIQQLLELKKLNVKMSVKYLIACM